MRTPTILLAATAVCLAACSGTSEAPSTLNASPPANAAPEAAQSSAPQAAPPAAPQAAPPPVAATAAPAPQTAVPAPPPPKVVQVITDHDVPQGTLVQVELETALSSGTNRVGDQFTARVVQPVLVDGEEAIPVGAQVVGEIAEVKQAKRGAGHASMTLRFTGLRLEGGFMTNIRGSVSEETGGKKKRNAAIIGGSAAGGALLGRVLGDDTKDAAIGAVVGGAIGTGVVFSKQGEQVEMPAGTPLTLTLEEAVQVPNHPANS